MDPFFGEFLKKPVLTAVEYRAGETFDGPICQNENLCVRVPLLNKFQVLLKHKRIVAARVEYGRICAKHDHNSNAQHEAERNSKTACCKILVTNAHDS